MMWDELRPMKTDPARQRSTDPGTPTKCLVWALHEQRSSEEDQTKVYEGCTTAAMGCFECKKMLVDEPTEAANEN